MRKAEDDYQLADRSFPDQLCFHCQQTAEKYLKALLIENGVSVPKTHDLEKLLSLHGPHCPSLVSIKRGLTFLTNFAVPIRYPGANATKRQAASAVRAILGVEP